MTSIVELVSVARLDRPVWIYRLAVESLIKHHPFFSLTIVCPGPDKPAFLSLEALGSVNIVAEEDYMPHFTLKELSSCLPGLPHRVGWYYQQFLKMHYCTHSKSSNFLIWDLDTVLLNPLLPTSDPHSHSFGSSSEYHSPYFRTIDHVLGPGAHPPRSSICQYMFVTRDIMLSMLNDIEANTGQDWRVGILQCLPRLGDSEFSEYETYATYVFRKFPNRCTFSKARLFRYGSELASSYAEALSLSRRLCRQYDLLAFERHLPSKLRRTYAYTLMLRSAFHKWCQLVVSRSFTPL